MKSSINKLLRIYVSHPYTWFTWLVSGSFAVAYLQYFKPKPLLLLGLILITAFIMFLWTVLLFRSSNLKIDHQGNIVLSPAKSIEKLLKNASPDYAVIAKKMLILSDKILSEFEDQSLVNEVESLLENIKTLTSENKILYKRWKDFGDESQKMQMDKMLSKQLQSIKASLQSLKTFSGNLALLDVKSSITEKENAEIKAINLALTEIINLNL
jgi:hypothetical protein